MQRVQQGGRCILIVEDEPEVAEELAEGLAEEGHECLLAASVRDARDGIAQAGDRISLVITDIRMPGGNGIDFTRELQHRAPPIPVIVMTGHAAATDIEAALARALGGAG